MIREHPMKKSTDMLIPEQNEDDSDERVDDKNSAGKSSSTESLRTDTDIVS